MVSDMKKSLLQQWLLVALCALLLVCGLVACSNENQPEEQPPEETPVEVLALADEASGAGIYTVVRPEQTDKRVTEAASSLRAKLLNYYGIETWDIVTDWEKDPNPDEIAARYEILVGLTNRPESEQVFAELGEDQYAIRVVNNKLVIVGVDDKRTTMAVKFFIDTYLCEDASSVIHKELNVLNTAVYTVQSTADGPIIVNTLYTTEDVVVADVYLSEEDYGIDPTGAVDASNIIQKALNDCHNKGGGTVYLPAGKYRITKNITVPAFVCLRGDWQDPDEGNEYGTIIIADVKSKASTSEGLFILSGSAGVHGVTVYYPGQSLDNPQPYPATFFIRENTSQGFMASTVANVTVINGYEGVRTQREPSHEQLTVENFKGTFLSVGLYLTNSSDVGTCTNISVRPNYWPEFAKAMGYTAPDATKLKAYTRANASGFEIGDLEWTEFIHITVSDCKYGIHIIDGERISFAGSFYDTVVMDCDVALQADDMDARWGMQISNSYLVGSVDAIVNNSDGVIKTAGTTAKGGLMGTVLVDDDNLTQYKVDTGISYKKPVAKLYTDTTIDKTGKTDVSAKLQALLDEAGKTGGVVYLPAGTYLLANPITVPSGVELRGCLPIANREQVGMSKGTMFHVTYGLGGGEDDQAAVTLSASSGVNGIRFQSWENRGSTRETAYMVRGMGKDVYLVYCSFLAAGRGVDFAGCDNHLIKKLTTFCYINDIRVGGDNGYIVGMLHNGNMVDRHGLPGVSYPVTAGYASENHVARVYNATIIVDGAENETIYNSFAYGVRHLIHQIDSKNTLAVNVGADNIGDNSPQLLLEGGSFVGVNILRYNGISCEYTSGTSVRLYARLGISERREETLIVK